MAKRKMKIPSKRGGRPKKNNQKDIQKQLNMLTERLGQQEQEREETKYTASSGGGYVEATVNGNGKLEELVINPEVVDEDDIEMLVDLVIAAVNEALEQSRAEEQNYMNEMFGEIPNFDLNNILS